MKTRIGSTALVAVAAAAGLAAVLAATPRAETTARYGEAAVCTATFEPDSVAIRQEPITVVYTLSEDIGGIASVTAPEDSGIEVVAWSVEDSTLDLDTGGALEGMWELSFVGNDALTCAGTLNVLMADAGLR